MDPKFRPFIQSLGRKLQKEGVSVYRANIKVQPLISVMFEFRRFV
jgi:hypothetical protein